MHLRSLIFVTQQNSTAHSVSQVTSRDNIETHHRPSKQWFTQLLLIALISLPLPGNASDPLNAKEPPQALPTVTFNIPRQAADDALPVFGQQANVTVIYPFNRIKDHQTNALQGVYSVPHAVAVLLADTGLEGDFSAEGHLVITQVDLSKGKRMNITTKKSLLATMVGLFAATGGLQQAYGQDGEEATAQERLDEIIVTATKREVNLQETALSITAVTGEELENLGVVALGEFVENIPGASLINQGPGKRQVVLRGVTTSSFEGGRATTGTYLNDFPLVGGSADMRLVDIDRVEVLKGPQGTLYGKSAMGGIVRYITNKPDTGNYSGGITLYASDIEEGGSSVGGHAYLNVPLSESLAARTVLYRYDNAGFIDNVGTDSKDVNTEETSGGRLALRWDVSDTASVDFEYHSQAMRSGGATGLGTQSISSTYSPTPHDGFNPFAPPNNLLAPDLSDPSYFNTTNGSNSFDVEALNLNVEMEFDPYTVNLMLSNKQILWGSESDSSPYVFVYDGITHFDKVEKGKLDGESIELRFVSKTGGFIDWIAGIWYESEEGGFKRKTIGSTPTDLLLFGFFPSIDGDVGEDSIDRWKIEETAIYGEVGLNLTEKTRLSLGYRRSDVLSDSELLKAAGTFDALVGLPSQVGIDEVVQEDVNTYKANLEHRFSDRVFVYATASSGYRVGGFNRGGLLANRSTYKSDTLWNYELGLKSSWLNDRLTANTSVYVLKWDDIQLAAFDNDTFVYGTVNVGSAQIEGVEAEVRYRATENLSLSINYAYLDAVLTEDYFGADDPTIITAKSGDRLPGSPKNSYSLFVDWRAPLSEEMTLSFNATYRYVGSRLNSLGAGLAPNESYDSVNVKAGIEHESGFQVSLFANNLLDERATNASALVGVITYTFVNQPRVFGLNVGYSF